MEVWEQRCSQEHVTMCSVSPVLSYFRVLKVQENCVQNFSRHQLLSPSSFAELQMIMKSLCSSRMKYLWTSHMCVFASFGLCSTEVWKLILKCLHLYTSQRVSTVLTAFHPLGFGPYLNQVEAQGWILFVVLLKQVSLLYICINLVSKMYFLVVSILNNSIGIH